MAVVGEDVDAAAEGLDHSGVAYFLRGRLLLRLGRFGAGGGVGRSSGRRRLARITMLIGCAISSCEVVQPL